VDIRGDVLSMLDSVLSLKGRAMVFSDDTRLLGSLAELDSMAVASVLTSLEERFGFTIHDDEIDGSTFETVGTLVSYVRGKLEAVA
jgi:acyl carrier protein